MNYAEITSLLSYVLVLIVPYSLASMGIMLGGRVGVFNISTEGVMLSGASVAFLSTYFTGNYVIGILSGIAVGLLIGLMMTFFSNYLRIDQFIVGILLYIFSTGFGALLYKEVIGVTLSPPRVNLLPKISIPILSQIPYLGPILFNQDAIVYLTITIAIITHYILFRTPIGLKLRSIGENPRAADALGINVFLMRHLFTLLGSSLMGLAGAYLALGFTGIYTNTIVSGRGWISIAITIFGKWSPLPILLGSLLFAGVEVLVYTLQAMEINIPYQLLFMLPFIVTLAILIYTSRRAEMPASLGKPYDREAIEE
ncbi:MAG: ABC transporter permease [Fervidicoccaceae archaeon]